MNIRRTAISFLCMVVFLFSSNAYALTSELNVALAAKEEYFLDMGHGEFKVDEGIASVQQLDSEKKKVKVKKINSEIYEILDAIALSDNKDYNKLVKVDEDTLLRVKELKIDLLNSKQLEMYIEEYEISPEMAKDIRERSKLAQEKDSEIGKDLVIYTPNFSKKTKNILATATGVNLASLSTNTGVNIAALSPANTYYYTGYNGESYRDETWYGYNTPNFYNVRTGYTVEDYFYDVLNNTCEFAIGGASDTLTGGAYTLAEIFMNSPVLEHPSDSGDSWQAKLTEDKWRKYTSIELWDDVSSNYNYYVRAVSDKTNVFFTHRLYRYATRTEDFADDPLEIYEGEYFYDLDEMAYLYMYDFPYTEYIRYHWVNDYTRYASQN
ncbi:MAG TPA: hypothetical protein VEF53_17890 [Patescibacteria group bacterium]|nr:hypothetical protein [Patescibacteria group bacterium]